jgi:3-methyladenine DNA glycosylase Tag
MSHRITKEEAIQKYERELQNRELIKKGEKIKSTRAERKKLLTQSKYEKFVNMLKSRGGHISQKKKKEKKETNNVEEKTEKNDQ